MSFISKASKLKSVFVNLALTAATLILFAYAASAVLWVRDKIEENRTRMFQFDEKLGWRFSTGATGPIGIEDGTSPIITINPEGYRDQPFSQIPSGYKKIAVIGDSFVSNIKVKDQEVFTEVLETRLPNTSVMNFGVNGYGQTQQYLFMDEIFKFDPDMIILVIFIENDLSDNWNDAIGWFDIRGRPHLKLDRITGEITLMPTAPPPSFFDRLHFPKPTRFYYFLRAMIEKIRFRFQRQHLPEELQPDWEFISADLIETQPKQIVEDSFPMAEYLLKKISEKASGNNTPIFFVIAPSKYQVEDKEWIEFLKTHPTGYDLFYTNHRLMDILRRNNLPFLDLYPRLKKEARNGVMTYNPYELHWNTEGNAIVADEILKFIQKNFETFLPKEPAHA